MKKTLPVKVCDACGEPFEPESNRQKRHQTKKCKNINERKLYDLCKKPLPMINCGSCGERFRPSTRNQKKHVTRDCKRIYEREREGWEVRKDIIICQMCGLPLKTTSPNQKIHTPRNSDCFKLYSQLYALNRYSCITGRHVRGGDRRYHDVNIDRIYKLNLNGECRFRDCLKCGKNFKSISNGNRVCHNCGISNVGLNYDTNKVHLDTSTVGGD